MGILLLKNYPLGELLVFLVVYLPYEFILQLGDAAIRVLRMFSLFFSCVIVRVQALQYMSSRITVVNYLKYIVFYEEALRYWW